MIALQEEELLARFRELLEEIGCPGSLQWCRKAIERRMAEVCCERAHAIQDGESVEVTEGNLAGRCGRVVAHCRHAKGSLLVELDGIDAGVPIPIPSWALRAM